MATDALYMHRCYELAQLGAGKVSPNPMVGALLVHKGIIISEAYHQRYGGPHAEALVIEDIHTRYGTDAPHIFANSTLYVSLEPCSHFGKTPPCADAIIANGIPRVVIGSGDPSKKVDGKGILKLKQAGVQVEAFIEEEKGHFINRRFFIQQTRQRPYVILKWAQTSNGYMAPKDRSQAWITGEEAKILSHRWRTEEDAILVGTRTVLVDDPQLTAREWPGRSPVRIVIDRDRSVPSHSKIFDEQAQTIVFNAEHYAHQGHIRHIALPEYDYYLPQQILYQLYLLDIQSVIIEGGVATLTLFYEAGLWDEIRVLESPVTWEEGQYAPILPVAPDHTFAVGKDHCRVYYANHLKNK